MDESSAPLKLVSITWDPPQHLDWPVPWYPRHAGKIALVRRSRSQIITV
jgi:hypothetical protein